MARPITVFVDHVVLHGVAAHWRHRLGDVLAAELTGRFAGGIPGSARPMVVEQIRAAPLPPATFASAPRLGGAIAERIESTIRTAVRRER